ncbi:hypothetical protein X474_03670 [Dethiosulfatarculus sandiegensis]|uniref:Uncharacterized protein n=1 Tax=Dethiosulfatarculus sandiegensis TaxID=1429043 RepID=A0A0D2JBB5_9BACT|nr:hypothetical protein X474_03670 [Dethiosulfatarculus sandiegensis]
MFNAYTIIPISALQKAETKRFLMKKNQGQGSGRAVGHQQGPLFTSGWCPFTRLVAKRHCAIGVPARLHERQQQLDLSDLLPDDKPLRPLLPDPGCVLA